MAGIVTAAARSNRPIFCEKPPGVSSVQTRAMADAARTAGVTHQVAFNRMFGPFVDRVRQWLAEAGPLTRIEAVFRRVFTASPAILTGSGIHALSLVVSLAGPVKRVMGARSAPRPGQGFCHFHAAFEFASGASGAFLYDNRMAAPAEEYHLSAVSAGTLTVTRIDLAFPTPTKVRRACKATRARLVYRDWGQAGAVFDTEVEEYARPDLLEADELLVGGGYLAEHQAFAAALRSGTPASPTFAQTVHIMELAETIQAGQYREFGS